MFKLAWQADNPTEQHGPRDLISPELARDIRVATSVEGPTRQPSASDNEWWLAVAIPFNTLSSFTGEDIGPQAGTEWRGNFYRSGVESDTQKATWNPMPTPEPAYHSPEYFGRLRFE